MNNAALAQYDNLEDLTSERLDKIFAVNWGRQPNKKNPTKIQQIQQYVGFFVGFFEDPNTQQRRSMLGFFVGFLLGFSEDLFDSCWVFGSFVGFLLGNWLICWIFVGSRFLFYFILERIFLSILIKNPFF